MSSHPSTKSPHVNSSSTSPPSKRIANPYIKRSKEGKQVHNDSLYDDLYDDLSLSTPNLKKLNVDVVTESPRNSSDSNNRKRQGNKQFAMSTKLDFDDSNNDQDVNKIKSKTSSSKAKTSSSKAKTSYGPSKTEPKRELFEIDWTNSELLRDESKKYDPSKKTQEDIITLILNESSLQNVKTAFALLVGQNQATTAFMPLPQQRNKVMENFLVLIYNLKSMIVDDTEHEYW